MVDRHTKLRSLRNELYFIIIIVGIFWSGLFILLVGSGILRIFNAGSTNILCFFFSVGILLFATFGLSIIFPRIRPVLQDFNEQPAEVEGVLSDKRSSFFARGNYLHIDTVGFDLGCDDEEWDMVDKGDRVHAVYHRNSKHIESIDVLEKAV